MGGIERVEMGGEAAHDREPHGEPARTAIRGQRRPGKRGLDRDRGAAPRVEEGGELGEQPAGPLEPEAERAAEAEVVGEGRIEAVHAAPPGQGRARSRSARSSTFA